MAETPIYKRPLSRRTLMRLGLAGGGVALLPWGGRALASETATAAGAVSSPPIPITAGRGGQLAYFGRMFPKLSPFAPDPDQATALSDLSTLADAMLEPGGGFDTVNGAIYTYFGQFLDHDITLDLEPQPSAFFSFAGNGPRAPLIDPNGAIVYDYESKKFDLSSIYGGGPKVSPELYDSDGIHFLVPTNVNGVVDLPRNPDGSAIIVEHRNDENQITSQLHIAFLLFHNAVADALGTGFSKTQSVVIQYYQWAILHDFMPTLFGQSVINDMLAGNHRIYDPGAFSSRPIMPVEFSVAGYRFGHSMVRNAYSMNPVISPNNKNARNTLFAGVGGAAGPQGGTGTPLTPVGDLHGGYPLTLDHQIDWRNFSEDLFDPSVPGASLQVFKQIGADGLHFIGQSMFGQPPSVPLVGTGAGLPIGASTDPADFGPEGRYETSTGGSNSIAYRDLIRAYFYLLPSGQDVATAMGITPFAPTTVIDPSVAPGFTDGTPLWFYIIWETFSQNQNSPTTNDFDNTGTNNDFQQVALGPVGARICTDVFLKILELDNRGVLDGSFQPAPPIAPAAGQFRIADLLTFAGVVPSGSNPAPALGQNAGPGAGTTTSPTTTPPTS
jgi:Animal haem peroxidase